MKNLLLFLLLVASLPAQIVHLENVSPALFDGWIQTTVDKDPPMAVGQVGDAIFALGPSIGRARVLDVRVTLAAGERRQLDLSKAVSTDWSLGPLPSDPIAYFGGTLSVAGQMLSIANLQVHGGGYLIQLRGRPQRMLQVDLWLKWHPDRPGMARGEVKVTASDPSIPDLTVTAGPLPLVFGDALVLTPGRLLNAPLVDPGTVFADGQCRVFPTVLIWPRHLKAASDWTSAGACVEMGVWARGLSQLLDSGTPSLPPDFDPRAWTLSNYRRCLAGLHDWSHPTIGPAADTGQTGSVEDQCFVGGEAFLPDGTPAIAISYLAAMKTGGHPMHHLETDGSIVDADRRPGLLMFYSRPLFPASPDKLGKPRQLEKVEAGNWNGPDAQHHTVGRLVAGALLTGSPALQSLVEHHQRTMLIQLSTVRGSLTGTVWSVRELGWEGIFRVLADQATADRALAARGAQHWRDRVTNIILPWTAGKEIWDIREDDLRLGPGKWWQPWQQAIACWGIDWACARFGPATGRVAALRGAKRVMQDGWTLENGRWVEYEHQNIAGTPKTRSGYFTAAWMPLAAATVLANEPDNTRARAIWAQIVQDAGGNGRWLPPGY